MAVPRLVVLPGLRVHSHPSGGYILTQKFLQGMSAFAEEWPGPVEACMFPGKGEREGHLDEVVVSGNALPFRISIRSHQGWSPRTSIGDTESVTILAMMEDENVHLPRSNSSRLTSVVFLSETTLKTRVLMDRAENFGFLRTARRTLRNVLRERQYRSAIAAASGVQCNGMPTFNQYRKLNQRALLFFDSRIRQRDVISSDQLESRLQSLPRRPRLRLAFSGRLIPIKGPMHLIEVAKWLRKFSVPFELKIMGDGILRPQLEAAILTADLSQSVSMTGPLDFTSELMPRLSKEVDLFVCCHTQGDPSCTYLETLACGVPIVGYGNEALHGLTVTENVGQSVRMGSARDLAMAIKKLHGDRDTLASMSRRARDFAKKHAFEEMIKLRIDHLLELSSPT